MGSGALYCAAHMLCGLHSLVPGPLTDTQYKKFIKDKEPVYCLQGRWDSHFEPHNHGRLAYFHQVFLHLGPRGLLLCVYFLLDFKVSLFCSSGKSKI